MILSLLIRSTACPSMIIRTEPSAGLLLPVGWRWSIQVTVRKSLADHICCRGRRRWFVRAGLTVSPILAMWRIKIMLIGGGHLTSDFIIGTPPNPAPIAGKATVSIRADRHPWWCCDDIPQGVPPRLPDRPYRCPQSNPAPAWLRMGDIGIVRVTGRHDERCSDRLLAQILIKNVVLNGSHQRFAVKAITAASMPAFIMP